MLLVQSLYLGMFVVEPSILVIVCSVRIVLLDYSLLVSTLCQNCIGLPILVLPQVVILELVFKIIWKFLSIVSSFFIIHALHYWSRLWFIVSNKEGSLLMMTPLLIFCTLLVLTTSQLCMTFSYNQKQFCEVYHHHWPPSSIWG